MLAELPHLVPPDIQTEMQDINSTVNKTHSRGCDWRKALILACICLEKSEACDGKVKHTDVVKLLQGNSTTSFARDIERTPKMVLHLSLALYREFELMKYFLHKPKHVSLGSLNGGYLQDLLHSPVQLMAVSLRSTTTESLERLQGTARRIGENVTSCRPADVPPTVIIRTQPEAEGRLKSNSDSSQTVNSEISRLAEQLPPPWCTCIAREMMFERKRAKLVLDKTRWKNFMALLQTIGIFLQHGPGVWW